MWGQRTLFVCECEKCDRIHCIESQVVKGQDQYEYVLAYTLRSQQELELRASPDLASPPRSDTSALPNMLKIASSPSEELMRVALMPNIKNKPIVGSFEGVMNRRNEFTCSKARSQVTSYAGNLLNYFLSQLSSHLRYLIRSERS